MKKASLCLGFFLLLLSASQARSEDDEQEVVSSTTPIGSPYYRHLANDYKIDLRELVKFERKGFGRTEIAMLVILSGSDVKKLKALGNRRIKDLVPMETLAKEAGMDYRSLVKAARDIKTDIEFKGEVNLPPPVFEQTKEEKKKEEDKQKEEEKKKREEKKK